MKALFAAFMIFATCALFSGEEDAETVYKLGITKLREAQTNHSALVPATKLLSQAASLFDSAGNEEKVRDVNASLYWAKKKLTLADIAVVKGNADITKRLELATKEIPVDQAKELLNSADAYAKSHAEDPLLVAIRYFEVADRFKETEAGRTAMDLSLKAMQRIGEQIKRQTYKAAPTDGKAFIKSEPPGAQILLITKDGGKLETGKVTPGLIQIPAGFQTVELNLKYYKPSLLTFEVDGKSISKPDAIKLEALTTPLDILFEDGWKVFVSGVPAKVVGTEAAETPCTIELPIGSHQVTLAKEGFIDISQRIEIKSLDAMTHEFKQKPSKGKSQVLSSPAPATKRKLNLLALVDPKRDGVNGDWSLSDGKLSCQAGSYVRLQVPYRPPAEYDFRIVFVRKSGNQSLAQFITIPHPTMWTMNAWYSTVTGWDLCDGQRPDNNPSTLKVTAQTKIVNGKPHESLIKVRKDKIECYFDQQLIHTWDKGLERLQLHGDWSFKDRTLLGVGAYDVAVDFLTIEVSEISGPGTLVNGK